jgi:hypothetical protein
MALMENGTNGKRQLPFVCRNFKWKTKTEAPAIFLNSLYRLLIMQTEVFCLSVCDEETNGSYLFANRLN